MAQTKVNINSPFFSNNTHFKSGGMSQLTNENTDNSDHREIHLSFLTNDI